MLCNTMVTLRLLVLAILLTALDQATAGRARKKRVVMLAKQLSRQQFYVEEQARADGHSGLKVTRLRGEGTKPYHATSHTDGYTMASIHDHSDFSNTCGMGEIIAVLNGVHFKTRHNDYLVVRRGDTPTSFSATVPIPYPDMPPSVLAKSSVLEQIQEMRRYFEAFAKQDDSIRDYKPYF